MTQHPTYEAILSLRHEVEAKQKELKLLSDLFAQQCCPYLVGDMLRASRGIGEAGMQVVSIQSPSFFRADNRWAITCAALTKAGEVSKRQVTLSEWDTTLTVITRMEGGSK